MTSFLLNGIDLQPDDDLSVLTFGDIIENIDFQTNTAGTVSKPCSTIEIVTANDFVPVSDDDDESISYRSLFSWSSFQNGKEEPHSKAYERPPSFEIMVSKLNSMMMRSARSRAIISKTVLPDLKKKTRKISFDSSSSSSTTKPSVHKAGRPSSKHSRRNNDKISTDSMRLGSRQDSCIGGFLRASKKW